MSALFDARGCLSPAGVAAVQRAPVGRAPAELAQHLASCGRCQARLLAGSGEVGGWPPSVVRSRPLDSTSSGRLWRLAVFALLALALALAALVLAILTRR